MASSIATRWQITSRIAASVLGSYVFVWGLVVLGIAVCLHAGLSYSDAAALAALLAFVVFLVTFLWAFVAASVARVWGVLLSGGGAMTAAAWWLVRTPA
jgi:hypothetical protein